MWKGSAFGGWKSRDSVPKLVEGYLQGKVMVDEFVTGEMPLAQINEAFHLMHAGKRYLAQIPITKTNKVLLFYLTLQITCFSLRTVVLF